jgi:hypothetical protein
LFLRVQIELLQQPLYLTNAQTWAETAAVQQRILSIQHHLPSVFVWQIKSDLVDLSLPSSNFELLYFLFIKEISA